MLRVLSTEFIPEGRSVNKEMHREIIRRLRGAVKRKRAEKWARNSGLVSSAHRSSVIRRYLAEHNVTALEHAINSVLKG
jgi:U3 small nucleolar ribonucleoprotein component